MKTTQRKRMNKRKTREMSSEEMNGYFNFMSESLLRKISENVMQPPESKLLSIVIDHLLKSERIFGTGAGRSRFAVRSFFMRLMHLGFNCYIEGETTTPAIQPSDCLIAVTGSGETPATKGKIAAAKKIGATIIVVTSFPESPSAKYADIVIEIKGRNINNENGSEKRTERENTVLDYSIRQLTGATIGVIAPMGTLFEDSTTIFFDALISLLMIVTGQSEKDMKERHDNLS